MTGRVLAALAWLRWRVLLNSLTRAGTRDVIERLSRALESVIPIAIVVVLVPAAVTLAGLGGWTGLQLGRRASDATFALQIVRGLLMAVLALTVAGPVLVSGANQGPGLVRLLLLPISARLLYVAHAAGAVADPWIFLCLPLLLGAAAGLAGSGAIAGALVALGAGIMLLLVLLGIAALSSAILQLVVRDRRRAELIVLLGTLLIVAVSLLPSALIPADRGGDAGVAEPSLPGWVSRSAGALPSHLYVSALRAAAPNASAPVHVPMAGLFVWAFLAHGLTWRVYRRLLVSPATSGPARRATGPTAEVQLPGTSPAMSAVAIAFTRLGFRTPRGRSVVLMPLVMLGVFAAMALLRGQSIPFGPVRLGGGYSLGIFGVALSLLSLSPLAFNQFAVDKSGLTLQFLSPISARELLYGKALGAAALAAVPCVLAIVAGIATGGRSLALWLAVALGAWSVYALLAPVAAVLAMLLPRSVDLSSIGSASNAHQAAGLLGVLSFGFVCLPPALLAWAVLRWTHHPLAVALALAAWAALASVASITAFGIAARLLEQRRENLAMVAGGR